MDLYLAVSEKKMKRKELYYLIKDFFFSDISGVIILILFLPLSILWILNQWDIIEQNHHKEKNYILYGNFYSHNKQIFINCEKHYDPILENIDDCIKSICNTIAHEELHRVINEELGFNLKGEENIVRKLLRT